MKLYIKEFYKSAERYFLCKENHITLYKPYYVLYDLKEKKYLTPPSVYAWVSLSSLIPCNHFWYYGKEEIHRFLEHGQVVANLKDVFPSGYCNNL